MLDACHERVERTLQVLLKLAQHLSDHGNDEQARQAALDVMRYFDQAGPAHHLDEERHLFPALAQNPNANLQALAQQLQAEHLELAQRWQQVRQDLQRVCGPTRRVASADSRLHWADFASRYRSHMQAEDTAAYPAARALLDVAAQQRMGQDMAARRGVNSAGP
jgi:hemerythrin-like domain-containing protein